MTDLLCIGTTLIDSFIFGFTGEAYSNTGFRAGSAKLCPGGEAFNVSVTASRLGLKTKVLSHIGNDSAGKLIETELREAGVDTAHIVRDDEPTPVTTMFIAEDGSRKSITNGAHKYNFHPEKYLSVIMGAKNVALCSLMRAPFNDSEIIYEVLRAAKAEGAVTYCDTKIPNFVKIGFEDIRESAPLIDYLTPNADEAKFFSGYDDPEDAADYFLSLGIKNVLIKLGPNGCLFKNESETLRLPAFVIDVVDATGCGDNMLAGLIASGDLKFASMCAGLCLSKTGAACGVESREQVERELLKRL
ncbi:MAG: carbohydrate kinase family protein [Eubacteriales bacterium]|nr:carbohydrate kinase family protein [Eubacteriales bacterium]